MKQKTVVIIDDDADDLGFMKEALSQVDSTLFCISFIYPDEALRLLSKELILLPDFIFIDLNMPRFNGYECLQQLRSISQFEKTPVIMYSTSLSSIESEKYLQQGATFTFEKPRIISEYVSILEAIIFNSGFHHLVNMTNKGF